MPAAWAIIFSHDSPIGREVQNRRYVRDRVQVIGIQIVEDQRTKRQAPDLRNAIVDLAFHKGLCIRAWGTLSHSSLSSLIHEEQADFAVRILEERLREAETKI